MYKCKDCGEVGKFLGNYTDSGPATLYFDKGSLINWDPRDGHCSFAFNVTECGECGSNDIEISDDVLP